MLGRSFCNFCSLPRGSFSEVDTLLTVSSNLLLLSKDDYEDLLLSLENISRPLYGLVQKLKAQTPGNP